MEEQEAQPRGFQRHASAISMAAARAGANVKAGVTGAAIAVADAVEDTGDRFRRSIHKMDRWADNNRIGRMFFFKERRSKLSTELRAGMITFLMVAYILAVNPQILGSTGGTCDAAQLCEPLLYEELGNECLFQSNSVAVTNCLSTLRMNLTTATAAASLIACFIMGFFANLPLALAPGMGINIYLAFQVVAQGMLTYQQALVAVFLEGWIFILLSMTGIRAGIIRYMPKNIAFATSVGIGLLLAFTGLRFLGIIVFDENTLVTLGGCPSADRTYVYSSMVGLNGTSTLTLSDVSEAAPSVYGCVSGQMRSPTMWLGVSGGLLMALLTSWGVNGSLFIGIAFVTVISWIPGHAASYLGEGSSVPGGAARMDIFKQVVAAPSLSQTGLAWDWSALGNGHFWVAVLTFLYIDLLDCTGTLLAMATLLDNSMAADAEADLANHPDAPPAKPFLNERREFPGQQWAFLADGLGIIVGSMMGVSPLTVFIESAAGIEDGGRTGVSAITVSVFFFVSLFFSPIFASIPPYATGPALILVGVLLISHADRIEWDDVLESVPAFLTIVIIPFTLSVAYGVIAGLVIFLGLRLPMWGWNLGKITWEFWKKRKVASHTLPGADYSSGFEDGGSPSGQTHTVALSRQLSRQITRRRLIHRKLFGEGDVQVVRVVSGESDDGHSQHSFGRAGGLDEIIVRDARVSLPGGLPMSPSRAALRRSTSHGSLGGGETPPRGTLPRSISLHRQHFGARGLGGSFGSRSGSFNESGLLATSLHNGHTVTGRGGVRVQSAAPPQTLEAMVRQRYGKQGMPPRSRTFSDLSSVLPSGSHMSLHALPFTRDVHTSFGRKHEDVKPKGDGHQQSFLFGDQGLLDLDLDHDEETPVGGEIHGMESPPPAGNSEVEGKGSSLVLGDASLDHDLIKSADLTGFTRTSGGTTSNERIGDGVGPTPTPSRGKGLPASDPPPESRHSFEFHIEGPLPSLSSWPMTVSPSYDNARLDGGRVASTAADLEHKMVRIEGWPSSSGDGAAREETTSSNEPPRAMGLKRSESMAAIRLRSLFSADGDAVDGVAGTSSAASSVRDHVQPSMKMGRSGSAPPAAPEIEAPPSPFDQIGALPKSPRSGKSRPSNIDLPETIVSGEVFQ